MRLKLTKLIHFNISPKKEEGKDDLTARKIPSMFIKFPDKYSGERGIA